MKHSVLVVGLGRFGTAAALELMALGHEVLAVDIGRGERSTRSPPRSPTPSRLDATDEGALRAVGAADFEHAIVAISGAHRGQHLRDDGAQEPRRRRNVVAKAGTELHGAILERVGADRVDLRRARDGERVAHSLQHPPRHRLPRRRAAVRHRQDSARRQAVGRQDARRARPPGTRQADPDRAPARPGRDGQPVSATRSIAATDELILIGRDRTLEAEVEPPTAASAAARQPRKRSIRRRQGAGDQDDEVGGQRAAARPRRGGR